ncbi:D-aminoacyl-tRNA deacylase [Desulfonatronum thiodismutans]|uniref:D-aminoacyl-tRNA deacylase n=1 Tax=Desulfonatronum thiodismutans TaxID=159290 RepID=UPI0004ABDDAB|nr:D-aminoacyl-tRNA deacylase [Desulfonatronum thiodismutans]
MRLVIQRVTSASVTVEGEPVAAIDLGLLVLVGFGREDEDEPTPSPMLARMARKLAQVRIFPNETGRLDRDVVDVGGRILAVSQFTLHADCRKGRRPSLHPAADPRRAETLFTAFVSELESLLPTRVATGRFGREMNVALCNWGPLTLVWDSLDV